MTDSQRYPFLDAYGIFPSHRKIEADGTVWSQDPPQGVALRVQTAALSDVFLAPERPWEEDSDLGIVALLHEEGRYRLFDSSPHGAREIKQGREIEPVSGPPQPAFEFRPLPSSGPRPGWDFPTQVLKKNKVGKQVLGGSQGKHQKLV